MKRTLIYVILGAALLFSPLTIDGQAANVGTISFTSNHAGNSDLYLIDSTGQNLQRFPTDDTNKYSHSWSPDGRFFAYQSNDDGPPDIYVMDIRNKESRRLTHGEGRNLRPAWSPNGRWIAFVSDRAGSQHIYRIDVDGSNLRRLTNRGDNGKPAWSPDSQWIAFNSHRGGDHDAGIPGTSFLYVMTADGRRSRQLTEHASSGCTWSPDGKQIAFTPSKFLFEEGKNILVIDVDGNNLRKLTHVGAGAWASDPAWSPDGKWIAYSLKKMVKRPNPGERVPINEVFGDGAIYVVNAIGGIGEPLEIANGLSPHPAPAWVPEPFFSVSPSAETQATVWGRLKKSGNLGK